MSKSSWAAPPCPHTSGLVPGCSPPFRTELQLLHSPPLCVSGNGLPCPSHLPPPAHLRLDWDCFILPPLPASRSGLFYPPLSQPQANGSSLGCATPCSWIRPFGQVWPMQGSGTSYIKFSLILNYTIIVSYVLSYIKLYHFSFPLNP